MTDRHSDGPLRIVREAWGGLLAIGVFSFFTNVLALTLSIYMMQVFDRVLTGRSFDTLLFLTLAAVTACLVQVAVDDVRGKVLARIGLRFETELAGTVLAATLVAAGRRTGATAQPLRDLAELRQSFGSPAMLSFFDLPWAPLYLAALFLLHPVIGWLTVAGAVLLFSLALLGLFLTARVHRKANEDAIGAFEQVQDYVDHADAILAMGMTRNVVHRWRSQAGLVLRRIAGLGDLSGVLLSTSKLVRLLLQIAVQATGAFLVIGNEMSAGGMIAGSILMGRALAPADQAVGAWRVFAGGLQALHRVRRVLDGYRDVVASVPLGAVSGRVTFSRVHYAVPGQRAAILRGIGLTIEAGEAVGIVGPSGAGKSTLLRLMVGVEPATAGEVRLDGADVGAWDRGDLGRHIGYLPQDVQLFGGTVRDNIARLSDASAAAVVEAAEAASLDRLIVQWPQGYDTRIGRGGIAPSGGQQQRIGLARALFGWPSLLVLDEPDANLDPAGTEALMRALDLCRQRGCTVVVVSHRPTLVRWVSRLILVRDGTIEADGARDAVLARLGGASTAAGAPADGGGPSGNVMPLPRRGGRSSLEVLPWESWLQPDRAFWAAATAEAAADGAASPSRTGAYGCWLAWVRDQNAELEQRQPAERLTRTNLQSFLQDMARRHGPEVAAQLRRELAPVARDHLPDLGVLVQAHPDAPMAGARGAVP